MPAASFWTWFYVAMLQKEGWPRKVGLRRREVVDVTVADETAGILGNLGAVIGVYSPSVAVDLLADVFIYRDWDSEPPDERFQGVLEILHQGGCPSLAEYGSEVPWDIVASDTSSETSRAGLVPNSGTG